MTNGNEDDASPLSSLILVVLADSLPREEEWDQIQEIALESFSQCNGELQIQIVRKLLPLVKRGDYEHNEFLSELFENFESFSNIAPMRAESLWEALLSERHQYPNGFDFPDNSWEDMLSLYEEQVQKSNERVYLSDWYLKEEKRLAEEPRKDAPSKRSRKKAQ